MNDIEETTTVVAASDIEVDHATLDASIKEFAGDNGEYYADKFQRIHSSTGMLPNTFNPTAAILGPIWAAARGVWGMFWGFLILEMIAWVQIGRGWWGDPGASFFERAEKQRERAAGFLERAEAAKLEGADPSRFEKLAENINNAAEKSEALGVAASSEALQILVTGIVLLLLIKAVQGFYANSIYEKQYSRWRVDHKTVDSGRKPKNSILGIALVVLIGPLTIYKFTVDSPLEVLNTFPEKQVSSVFLDSDQGTLFTELAGWLEQKIDNAAIAGAGAFDSVTASVRWVLDGLSLALIVTPWPVVMLVICVVAWRAAGPDGNGCSGRCGRVHLRNLRYPAGHLVWQIEARLQRGGTGTRFDADASSLRLPDSDHRFLWHRQPARDPGDHHFRDAAGHSFDLAWRAWRARHDQGSGGGVWRLAFSVAERRGSTARPAFDHDRC
jgi:glycine betaine/proline transport system permease protein